MSRVTVVLTENVRKLGGPGTQVKVRRGYYRNFLGPTGKAVYATPEALLEIKAREQHLQEQDLERKEKALVVSEVIRGVVLKFFREASDSGVLYGSVTPMDVQKSLETQFADQLAQHSFALQRSSISFPHFIKSVGSYEVSVDLHPEVIVPITIDVERKSTRNQ